MSEHVPLKNANDLATGSKPAPGGLAWVQGFVNTVDLESGRDALATPADLARWLGHHGLVAPSTVLDDAAHARALAFREALRSFLFGNHGDPVDPAAVQTLNAVAGSAPLHVRFAAGGGAELEPMKAGVEGALGMLASLVYHAMREGTWERLKACRRDSCQWAFYDASRNRSGAWCTMATCGNRSKVEAHRRRAAGDG